MDWHDYFYYDETSKSCLRRKIRRSNALKDSEVGWVGADGYWCCELNNRSYLVHRIIWEMCIGDLNAINKIDHINHNRLDNRIENLRLASDADNARNCSIPKNNTSGYMGVSYRRKSNRYYAYITVDYNRIHLGCFKTAEDAARAYDFAAIELFGEYASLNFSQ